MAKRPLAKQVNQDRLLKFNEHSPKFADTYTERDYEVVLDVLYGMFSKKEAGKIRIFDPFVEDSQQAPLITPRMLTERLERVLLQETAIPEHISAKVIAQAS